METRILLSMAGKKFVGSPKPTDTEKNQCSAVYFRPCLFFLWKISFCETPSFLVRITHCPLKGKKVHESVH